MYAKLFTSGVNRGTERSAICSHLRKQRADELARDRGVFEPIWRQPWVGKARRIANTAMLTHQTNPILQPHDDVMSFRGLFVVT